jgi:hypothetical protein
LTANLSSTGRHLVVKFDQPVWQQEQESPDCSRWFAGASDAFSSCWAPAAPPLDAPAALGERASCGWIAPDTLVASLGPEARLSANMFLHVAPGAVRSREGSLRAAVGAVQVTGPWVSSADSARLVAADGFAPVAPAAGELRVCHAGQGQSRSQGKACRGALQGAAGLTEFDVSVGGFQAAQASSTLTMRLAVIDADDLDDFRRSCHASSLRPLTAREVVGAKSVSRKVVLPAGRLAVVAVAHEAATGALACTVSHAVELVVQTGASVAELGAQLQRAVSGADYNRAIQIVSAISDLDAVMATKVLSALDGSLSRDTMADAVATITLGPARRAALEWPQVAAALKLTAASPDPAAALAAADAAVQWLALSRAGWRVRLSGGTRTPRRLRGARPRSKRRGLWAARFKGPPSPSLAEARAQRRCGAHLGGRSTRLHGASQCSLAPCSRPVAPLPFC